MPQSVNTSIENNFIGGLKTEFTSLNFPENACTDTDNCVFSLIGDVTRREGFDYEANNSPFTIDRTNVAISTYRWVNVGGDGSTQFYVLQVGGTLYFFNSSAATVASPLSGHKLASTVSLSTFSPSGAPSPNATECQYADGNGYLFVFHPNLEPFYCVYNSGAGTVSSNSIKVQVRDDLGIIETGIADNFRPTSISAVHQYNLANQGWTTNPPWSATSTTSITSSIASKTFTIQSGLTIANGTGVNCIGTGISGSDGTALVTMSGTVTSYSGTTLVVNVTNVSQAGLTSASWTINPTNLGFIATWNAATGNYPSNSDVWFLYKNSAGVFAPATTFGNISLDSGPAPKGFYIIPAFNQQRGLASGIATGTTFDIVTALRPRTGTWFQGRVWYSGVDAATTYADTLGNSSGNFYTWTENIYFSQTIVSPTQFGKCYDINDPTSENLFDILPTDGGVITIQGSGPIYKLFPVQNGLLVFAANGIWFITGSQGIGFRANDYTITKISSVRSISHNSFVNVLGYPVFWNEEGIYTVVPSPQGGGLTVDNLALSTILTFFESIPFQSKKYARGDYDPVNYVIQWCYRDTNETDVTSRYSFNKILNLNTHNKAFYPWSMSASTFINDIRYVVGPGGSTSPPPQFKYLSSSPGGGSFNFNFSEEKDTTFVDWKSVDGVGTNFVSFFVTGYKLHGNAQRKFQPMYVYMHSNNAVNTSYKIQGVWEYAINRNSGKYSGIQLVNITSSASNFGKAYRRHRIRGHGIVLQLKVISADKLPFDIMGWSIFETINAGV